MIWFTSDTHFKDAFIVRYIPRVVLEHVGCPTSFSDVKIREWLDNYICEQWIQLVNPTDTVYHIGDVGKFKNDTEAYHFLSKLPGHKILILGNHDVEEEYGVIGDPAQYWKAATFDAVHQYYKLGKFLHLQHIPPYFTNVPYMWLYGHIHSIDMYRTITPTSCCVCSERFLYQPVSFDFIQRICKRILMDMNEDGQYDLMMPDDLAIAEEAQEANSLLK